MKVYAEKEVTEMKKIWSNTLCDICGEVVKIGYGYDVTTGHHDWGNDSVDSVETFDICSDGCLQKKFEEYLAKVSDSKYIGVNR
jgi:hypothetical protein